MLSAGNREKNDAASFFAHPPDENGIVNRKRLP